MGGTVTESFAVVKVAVVTGLTEQDAAALEASPGVQNVVKDMNEKFAPSLQEMLTGRPMNFRNPSATGNPQDAGLFWLQWNMNAIDAPGAWSITQGSDEIRVGILDSGGSPDHQDLEGKYDIPMCINFSESDGYNPAIWVDRYGHGTHVAGTVTTNNIGVAGVAPEATLVAVKVLDDFGYGWFSDMIRGVIYATDVAHCDVINMSLGASGERKMSGRFLSTIYRVVNYANSRGVLVVMSAGNDMMDMDHNKNIVVIPAEAGSGMVVSATGPVDQQNFDSFSCFSNYGNSAISVAAPGGNLVCGVGVVNGRDGVLSCLAPWVAANVYGEPNPNIWYAMGWGTSMAAPHVAGAAVLVEAAKGNSNPGYLQAHIQNTADDLGAPGNDPYYGKGRLNVASAVQ